MIEIRDDNIDRIKDETCYLLFYFTATWCGPCQRVKPIIKEISKGVEDSKLKVCMIDIDENSELVEKYDIKSVPTMILLLNNEQKGICNGTNKEKLLELFKKVE
tara:strand:- start:1111 stop:1422 length:312 start_codon:yes stop_codon:yes gene_type:complete